jgi:bilirubin oxidase
MQFVVIPLRGTDTSVPADDLIMPPMTPLGAPARTRQVSLNELDSQTVLVSQDDGNLVLDCATGSPIGPTIILLGTLNPDGTGHPLYWMDPITENPKLGDTEVWEIYNFTMDAHPIHLHLVQFLVVNRQKLGPAQPLIPPEPWETGYKDTVIALPGQITRIKAKFDILGRFAWHCHIVSHEDNEMMRPYQVVP